MNLTLLFQRFRLRFWQWQWESGRITMPLHNTVQAATGSTQCALISRGLK
jgi:hypothetical protein